uniref:mannosyl-glycoprotein endo-beta-N-acetylglucosaminidase n=1 Tax=Rhizophora mucronata TaxID=61149 RepID=A0A2P2PM11_RHIMU
MSSFNETHYKKLDPAPFDPSQPSIPISYPLKTLEDLESRAYFNSFHCPFNISSVPLMKSSSLDDRPRILVCHDMKGGYTDDDKWVQGGDKESAYAIWHWYLIDVFVYFSHNLVTLPPPCWTNTAHRHGVKVLGTFITEFTEGRAICSKLLSTKESAQMYAERLAELAVALGFDGWLINMEVTLDLRQISNLKAFLSHLTQTMHSSVPGSLVIWYDGVTITGSLNYQNQLNEKNKAFFDICDGIFVNYSWEEDYPKKSAAVAGDRQFDVYVGIDAFGRGTYGGGQWNTKVALDVLKRDNVSAAIFAPGWIYETDQPPDFQTAQNRWWSLVEKSWGILKRYPKMLPFFSNFDQGHGFHISIEGKQVSSAPWSNISCQGLQPFLEFRDDPTVDTIKVLVDNKEASYNGGGNITFKGKLADNDTFTARLFQGELFLGELPLYFTYSVKSEGDSELGISLQFSSATNQKSSVLLAPKATSQFSDKFCKTIAPRQVKHPELAPGWSIKDTSIDMNGYTLTEIHALCYRSTPQRNDNAVSDGQDDKFSSTPTEYYAVLGHITIKTNKENSDFPPSSSWVVEGQYIKWSSGPQDSKNLSIKIIWKLRDGSKPRFSTYNIYVEKTAKQVAGGNPVGSVEGNQEYLGVANVQAFYVSNLPIPSGTSSLKFTIQVCDTDGACQELDDSPSFQLDAGGQRNFLS